MAKETKKTESRGFKGLLADVAKRTITGGARRTAPSKQSRIIPSRYSNKKIEDAVSTQNIKTQAKESRTGKGYININQSNYQRQVEAAVSRLGLHGKWQKLGATSASKIETEERKITDVTSESPTIQNNLDTISTQIGIISNFMIKMDEKFVDFEHSIKTGIESIADKTVSSQISLVNQLNREFANVDKTLYTIADKVAAHDKQIDEIYAQAKQAATKNRFQSFLDQKSENRFDARTGVTLSPSIQNNNQNEVSGGIGVGGVAAGVGIGATIAKGAQVAGRAIWSGTKTIGSTALGIAKSPIGRLAGRAFAVPATAALMGYDFYQGYQREGVKGGLKNASTFGMYNYFTEDKSETPKESKKPGDSINIKTDDDFSVISKKNIKLETTRELSLVGDKVILESKGDVEITGRLIVNGEEVSIRESQRKPKEERQTTESAASRPGGTIPAYRPKGGEGFAPSVARDRRSNSFSGSGGSVYSGPSYEGGYESSGSSSSTESMSTSRPDATIPAYKPTSVLTSLKHQNDSQQSSEKLRVEGRQKRVNEAQLKSRYTHLAKKHGLDKLSPKDAKTYGIDGSAESWANLLMSLTEMESGFKSNTVGDHGKFGSGSRGLLQLSVADAKNHRFLKRNLTHEELHDPDFNTDMGVKIMSKLIKEKGSISAGAGQYWGPIRRGKLNSKNIAKYSSLEPEKQTTSTFDILPGADRILDKATNNEQLIQKSKQKRAQLKEKPTVTNSAPIKKDDVIGSLKNRRRRESKETDPLFKLKDKKTFNWGTSQEARKEMGALGDKRNLVTITSKSGKKVTVNKSVAEDALNFINELEDRGYKIKDIGGYNFRNIRGSTKLSSHASGGTIDINDSENPFKSDKTDMPYGIKYVAMKHGFAQLGDDKMHFERVSPAHRKEYLKRLISHGILTKDDPFILDKIQKGVISTKDLESIEFNSKTNNRDTTNPKQEITPVSKRGLVDYSGARNSEDVTTSNPTYTGPSYEKSYDKPQPKEAVVPQSKPTVVPPVEKSVAVDQSRINQSLPAYKVSAVRKELAERNPEQKVAGHLKQQPKEETKTEVAEKSESSEQKTEPTSAGTGEIVTRNNMADSAPAGPSDDGYGDYSICHI